MKMMTRQIERRKCDCNSGKYSWYSFMRDYNWSKVGMILIKINYYLQPFLPGYLGTMIT